MATTARPRVADVLAAIEAEYPGWHAWYTSGPPRGWYAVPASTDATHTEALHLANRIGPFATAADCTEAVGARYGWHDHCETCGVSARECGHRQPERERD